MPETNTKHVFNKARQRPEQTMPDKASRRQDYGETRLDKCGIEMRDKRARDTARIMPSKNAKRKCQTKAGKATQCQETGQTRQQKCQKRVGEGQKKAGAKQWPETSEKGQQMHKLWRKKSEARAFLTRCDTWSKPQKHVACFGGFRGGAKRAQMY